MATTFAIDPENPGQIIATNTVQDVRTEKFSKEDLLAEFNTAKAAVVTAQANFQAVKDKIAKIKANLGIVVSIPAKEVL